MPARCSCFVGADVSSARRIQYPVSVGADIIRPLCQATKWHVEISTGGQQPSDHPSEGRTLGVVMLVGVRLIQLTRSGSGRREERYPVLCPRRMDTASPLGGSPVEETGGPGEAG